MKTLFILFIAAFVCLNANGQNEISGMLTDSLTGEGIPGAKIFIPEMEKGCISTEDGSYKIENLSRGNFSLQITMEGYQTFVFKFINPVFPIEKTIVMKPIVVESHGVVISTGFPGEQHENPVEVIQFDKQDLAKTGAPSLMTGLSTIPGVNQVSTGPNVGKPVIRGLSYNRVVVYSQGVRVENQQWGDEHGLGLSDAGIEKVEIIKGPSTLLYGSDAMGGVIRIYDEEPARIGRIEGDGGVSLYSNTLGGSGDLGIKGSGKVFRAGIRGGYKNHADYLAGDGTRVSFSRFNEKVIKANAGLNLPWLVTNVRYSWLGSNVGITEELDSTGLERDMDIPHQELTTHVLSNQSTLFLGKSKVKINAGYLYNARAEYEHEHHGDTTSGHVDEHLHKGIDMNLGTFNYDVKWYLPVWGKFTTLVGVQGMFQKNKNTGEELLVPDASITDVGVLGMVKYSSGKFDLQGGIRGDQRLMNIRETGIAGTDAWFGGFERNFKNINGALGGVVRFREDFLLRANFSTGFRAPNLAELTAHGEHHGTNRYEIGDSSLTQEKNLEADLGLHFHSSHISFDLSGFANNINGFIFLEPTDSIREGLKVFNFRQKDAFLYGGEAGLDIHPHPFDWLHWESTFSSVIAQFTGDGADTLATGKWIPLIPAFKLTSALRGEFKDFSVFRSPWISVSGTEVFAQNRVSTFESVTQAYFLLNAGAGADIQLKKTKISVMISGNNLLNAKYFDHLSRLKQFGINNMGRNITLTLRVPFTISDSNN